MRQRNPALDIIRIFAFLCVVGIHFFLNNNFYNIPVEGLAMAGMIVVRCFCMICVPLFLMLSGYLLKNKELSKKYYSRIFYILGIYLLSCVACGIYKILWEDLAVREAIVGIFDYQTASYGWYVEMYFGLFLLIPFLNMMYKGAGTQRRRLALVLTFLVLTALPGLLNTWDLLGISGATNDQLHFDPLIPDYWRMSYPITFYFMGAYLRDYPLRLKTGRTVLCIIGAALAFGLFCYGRSYGRTFIGAEWAEHRSIFCAVLSFFVFAFLAQRQWTSIGPRTAKVLSKVSSLTLGAYLCSEIFDLILYPRLLEQGYSMVVRMAFFPVIVGAIALCSLALSAVLNGIYHGIAALFTPKHNTPQ